MGEQSAARLKGVRYQHLYSWWELLQLLDEEEPYDYGYVEHPEAGAADDLTLHAKPGSALPSKYVQVKFHVDQRHLYSPETLATVTSGVRSLLHKLFDSWKKLRDQDSLEVWLVSNWASVPTLGRFIDGRTCRLKEDFFAGGDRSEAGEARRTWRDKLGATEEELTAFLKVLRLRLGFGHMTELEGMVDDRMGRYGLKTGEVPRALATDQVANWIEAGGEAKRITQEVLREAITSRRLWAPAKDNPKVSLWIHAWAKRSYEQAPTIELDWTAYFDRPRRRVPSQDQWDSELLPQLMAAKESLSDRLDGNYIDFRGKLPLTTLLAVGAEFPEVGGYSFRAEQPTRGATDLWRSDSPPSEQHFEVIREAGSGGSDILIALCMTEEAWSDIQAFYIKHPNRFDAVVYAEPCIGPGPAALRSDADAVALAESAKDLIRRARRQYRASRTHLILYGPASFSLFLGQRLNALGTIVTYERAEDGGYQPSLSLRTG
jgi:hypothetical protein